MNKVIFVYKILSNKIENSVIDYITGVEHD